MKAVVSKGTLPIRIKNPDCISLVHYEAFHARIGGRSSVFKNHQERMLNLSGNQLTGQAGNLALNIMVFKDDCCVDMYKKSREPFHINPNQGDNGMDIINSHIDIKNSFSLNTYINIRPNVMDYRLSVRPPEMHPDWIYVSALSEKLDSKELLVYLIGWARSSDFSGILDKGGIFDGSNTLWHHKLRTFPLPNIFPAYLQPYLRKGVVEGV
jgi:hypothetical protein